MNSWNSILQKLHHLAASTQEHLAKAGEKLRRQAAAVIFGITAAAALFAAECTPVGEAGSFTAFAETLAEEQKEALQEKKNDTVLPETEKTSDKEETEGAEDANIEDGEPENAWESRTVRAASLKAGTDGTNTLELEELQEDPEQENPSKEDSAKETSAETDAVKKDSSEETSTKETSVNGDPEQEDAESTTGLTQVEGLPEEDPQAAEAFTDYTESDYNVLLRIVQAEAGGCDMKGKILVANVILNRVGSDEFPDTITDVVYEKRQFSPVSNGSINRCKVEEETVEAVDRALAGEDYSEGALYFMNRRASSGSNVRWFDTHLDYLFQHGGHEFFK